MNIGLKFALLFAMLFCHIWDDFGRQGIMASMKQRGWWQENKEYSYDLYKNDYRIVLYEHAFSWSFMIALPLLIVAIYQQNNPLFFMIFISYIFNTLFHAYIDDQKANKFEINLIIDQVCHFIQIFGTWVTSLFFI